MNPQRPGDIHRRGYVAVFADGTTWLLQPVNGSLLAATVARDLGDVMGFREAPGRDVPPQRRIVVGADGVALPASAPGPPAYRVRWELRSSWATTVDRGDPEYPALVISAGEMLARCVTTSGGLLLHGALLARERERGRGEGLLLCGPGGSGKSTVASRIDRPWGALSDDQALVLDCGRHGFWAHPWPTWSRYDESGLRASWDVQHGVPVTAVAFLRQGIPVRAVRLSPSEAVGHAVVAAEEAGRVIGLHTDPSEDRELRVTRLDRCLALVGLLPAFELTLGLDDDVAAALDAILDSATGPSSSGLRTTPGTEGRSPG
jgi:hypothetical protein